MIRVSGVAIILENSQSEILLLLRDNKPSISYPDHWTLVGGKVEKGETSEAAAHREMLEEIGMDTDLIFWKHYDRQQPNAIVDQYIFTGKIDVPRELLNLGEGQDVRFFHLHEISNLKIGFEFSPLLDEYFQGREIK